MQQLKKLWDKKNWWLGVLLVAEILFVLFRFAGDFHAGQAVSITPDLIIPYADECTNDARGARIENFTGTFATTRWIDIQPGSYQVAITYVTNGNDGEATFVNDIMPTALYDKITLPAARTRTVFSLWMPVRCETAQLQFESDCGEDRVMYITGAELTPTHSYAYVRFLMAVLFFAVADYLLLLALHRVTFPLRSVKARYSMAVMAGIILLACLPLGFNYLIYGHDMSIHLARIEGLKSGLLSGQFPVRMNPAIVNDAGYPFSLMYSDLLLYPAAFLRILGFSLQNVYKLYIFAVTVGTAFITRHVLRKMLGSERVALVGTALYTLSMYRLSNVYVRAAVGEYSAMMFLPLVIYGLWRIYDQGPQGGRKPAAWCWLPFALGFSGLLQCHLLTTEMAVLFTVLFCLLAYKKTFTKPVFTALLKAAGAAVLWNLWFLVPLLQYMVQGVCNISGKYDASALADSAAFIGQIFMMFGGTGYSNSITLGIQDEMALTVGIALAMGAGLLIAALLDPDLKRSDRDAAKLGGVCLGFAALAIWMASDLFPWYDLYLSKSFLSGVLGKLQFAWRFLAPATVLLVFCTCCGLALFGKKRRSLAGMAAAALLVFTLIPAGSLLERVCANSEDVSYQSLAAIDTLSRQVGGGEYMPAELGTDTNAAWSNTEPYFSEGVEAVSYEKNGLTVNFSAQNTTAAVGDVTLPLLYYPGYTLSGDAGAVLDHQGGYLVVLLPAGWQGSVTVRFVGLWFWRVADVISLIGILGTAWLYRRGAGHRKAKIA